jgi:pantothenate synthetase
MVVRTVPALRRAVEALRARKAAVALVPTMGALHDGHVSLVRLAKRRAQKVIVSIFVNPTQFAPTEDFGSYPRTWKADVLDLGVKVIGSRTVRERDGLAMSSRNVYLSPEERQTAPTLFRAMKESAKRLKAGEDFAAAMEAGRELITGAGFALDYFEARHAETLAPITSMKDGPVRILVAAKLGTTRLIDNIGV